MLLEDTIETCIKCGTDVSIVENISFFPPDVQVSMDEENMQRKDNRKTVILIICIFVAIVLAIVAVLFLMNPDNMGLSTEESEVVEEVADDSDSQVEETVDEADDSAAEDAAQTAQTDEQETSEPAPKAIKDSKGHYYNYVSETDEAGNVVLNVMYPESFDTAEFNINYDRYSNRFPLEMVFNASGEDGAIRFVYMSPRQLWYKDSENRESYDNNTLIDYYMTFYKYESAKSYIEAMLETAYPGADYEYKGEQEASPEITEAVKEIAAARKKDLFERIKYYDYGRIGEGTTYAIMEDADYSANFYEYEIKTADNMVLFEKFFVPVIANKLYYANEYLDDRGNITEWYYFGFMAMEAGNEDLYEDYAADFNVFVENCVPTESFMRINQLYGENINSFVDSGWEVEPIQAEDLVKYASDTDTKLNELNASILNMLRKCSGAYYENDEAGVYAPSNVKVGFVSKENNKVFLSEGEDEYPGENYTELTIKEIPVSEGVVEEIKIPEKPVTNNASDNTAGIDMSDDNGDNQRNTNNSDESNNSETNIANNTDDMQIIDNSNSEVVDRPKKKRAYNL